MKQSFDTIAGIRTTSPGRFRLLLCFVRQKFVFLIHKTYNEREREEDENACDEDAYPSGFLGDFGGGGTVSDFYLHPEQEPQAVRASEQA